MKVVGSMGWVGSWFWISATNRVMKSLELMPSAEAEELFDVELLELLVPDVESWA
jgi:hypothetical protein